MKARMVSIGWELGSCWPLWSCKAKDLTADSRINPNIEEGNGVVLCRHATSVDDSTMSLLCSGLILEHMLGKNNTDSLTESPHIC